MCTAISFKTKDHYFGRTLDYEYSYEEQVVITPRNFPLKFRHQQDISIHFAMIGMAYVCDDYPLYYEATNEKGLSMAGLNFPDNAFFQVCQEGVYNVTTFEIIPWILGTCQDVQQAKLLLKDTNITDTDFSMHLDVAPLHWMIADRNQSIVVECTSEGMKVYDNPVGVMTNNPIFPQQMLNLSNYMNLTAERPVNRFSHKVDLVDYSRGMGAIGLPGDLSSASRFVRAAFTKLNSVCQETEEDSVSQFFHILGAVEQTRGCVHLGEGKYEATIYTSCCNTDKGIYYYTTYGNQQITAVDIGEENLEGRELICYPLITGQQIYCQNKKQPEDIMSASE
ncbi:MAG: choloylglycine hydrolase [Lachnospiraceae bacterium]